MGLVKEGAAETARRQLSLLGKKTGGGLARSDELVDAALVAVAREDAARREGASGGVGGWRCSAGVGSPRRVGKAEWGQSFGSTGRVLRRVAMAFIAWGCACGARFVASRQQVTEGSRRSYERDVSRCGVCMWRKARRGVADGDVERRGGFELAQPLAEAPGRLVSSTAAIGCGGACQRMAAMWRGWRLRGGKGQCAY